MDLKFSIAPEEIITAYKTLGNDGFVLLMVAAAYATKYYGRLPSKFTQELHPKEYAYYKNNFEPLMNGKAKPSTHLSDSDWEILMDAIDKSHLFDEDDRKVLKDMLEMWKGRGKYSRTEMVYTQAMCKERTGVESEKFIELRRFLKAEECLNWENRQYNDRPTSYHIFNETNLLALLTKEINLAVW